MFTPETTPIMVFVKGDTYDVWPLGLLATSRDHMLMGLLWSMGGIGPNVQTGIYYFNTIVQGEQTMVTLLPIN